MTNSNNNNFYNFNTAETASSNSLIPKGTLAKVKLKIKAGGYNDESKGFTGGYASVSHYSGSVYLKCEYTVISDVAGKYKGCKIWSMIGLFSHKNDNAWGNIGRSFIRSILNSSHGFTDSDKSPEAITARQIDSFADLDGAEFAAMIDIKKDGDGNDQNVIGRVITPSHKKYNEVMGSVFKVVDKTKAAATDDELPWIN